MSVPRRDGWGEDKEPLFGRLAVERDRLTQERLDEAREARERGARYTLVEEPGKDRTTAASAPS